MNEGCISPNSQCINNSNYMLILPSTRNHRLLIFVQGRGPKELWAKVGGSYKMRMECNMQSKILSIESSFESKVELLRCISRSLMKVHMVYRGPSIRQHCAPGSLQVVVGVDDSAGNEQRVPNRDTIG